MGTTRTAVAGVCCERGSALRDLQGADGAHTSVRLGLPEQALGAACGRWLLARSRFALNEHGGIARGHTRHEVEHPTQTRSMRVSMSVFAMLTMMLVVLSPAAWAQNFGRPTDQ